MNAVPQFTIYPLNISVIESTHSTLEMCVARVGQTSLDRNVIVTVQTGPKDEAIAQASGIMAIYVASYQGLLREEEKGPRTHCMRMHYIVPPEKAGGIAYCRTITAPQMG